MKKYLLSLVLLVSSTAFGATGAGNVSLVIGLSGSSTLPPSVTIPLGNPAATGGVFSIYAGPGTGNTANHVMPFRKNGALYKVANANHAYCFGFSAASGTAGSALFQFMSDTATFADNDLVSGLSAPVYQGGVSASYVDLTGPTTNLSSPLPGMYVFTQNTWPGIQIASAIDYRVSAQCYEAP